MSLLTERELLNRAGGPPKDDQDLDSEFSQLLELFDNQVQFRKSVADVLEEALEAVDSDTLREFCRAFADEWNEVADYGYFDFEDGTHVIHCKFDAPASVLNHVLAISNAASISAVDAYLCILLKRSPRTT